MKNKRAFLSLIFLFFLTFFASGCGDSSKKISQETEITLAPCIISYENSGIKSFLYASIRGTSISSAWVENDNGKDIGRLNFIPYSNAYELLTQANSGDYHLVYSDGSEYYKKTKRISFGSSNRMFSPSPYAPEWDPNSRFVTISFHPISGNVRYYLRFYYERTGSLAFETAKTTSSRIVEYISRSEDYIIELLADVIENNEVVAHARYIYKATSLY